MRIVDPNVKLAADGDLAAFEGLYKSYHRRVYGLCLRMTRNASDAEDLTQDVFVQVFRKLKTFRGESSFSTWLHHLTVNQVLMHFRRPVVRMERTTEDTTTAIEIKTANGASRMSRVDHMSLNEAIRQLSPGYRSVFLLHDIAGYEHQEIGKILGCAVGTSKSQLHKARMKLRWLLSRRALSKSGRTNEKMFTRKERLPAQRFARAQSLTSQVSPTESFVHGSRRFLES